MAETFFFQLWILLLAIDLVWSLITFLITKNIIWGWTIVNILAVIFSVFFIYYFDNLELRSKLWILMSIAVLRTVFDYILARKFYFPEEGKPITG